jgi:NAD(P)-dependent dehydrogenase (short-subunit alcohol dehydrogenase family)
MFLACTSTNLTPS